jgi:hypothetical protein
MIFEGLSIRAAARRYLQSAGAFSVVLPVGFVLLFPANFLRAQAQIQNQSQDQSASLISGFELRRLDEGAEIWIESTSSLRLVGMEMTVPGQIVIQLPGLRAPNHLLDGVFEGGPITEGSVSVQDSGRGPLTRVKFSLQPGFTHNLEVEGNVLRFKMRPPGYRSVEVSKFEKLEVEADVLRTSLSKSEASRQMLSEALTTASSDNQTLQSRFEALESRRRKLEAGLSSALSEFSQLEQALHQAKDSGAGADGHVIGPLNEKIAQLEAALADYASARYDLSNQLNAANAEKDALAEQLSQLRAESVEAASLETGDREDQGVQSGVLEQAAQPHNSPELVSVPPVRAMGSTLIPTNMRADPESFATPVALLASDIEVRILEVRDEWIQIQWQDQIGWVRREDLILPGSSRDSE